MNKVSLGIVGFLGILMPGGLLLVNIIVPLSSSFGYFNWLVDKGSNIKIDTIAISILILIAFTAGTILRTLPPKLAEWPYRRWSSWCLQNILERYLSQPNREHFSSIPDNVWRVHYDPSTVREERKHWRYMRLFNFAKNYVIARSERLAREVQTAEGLSRFTASVFWCSLVGFPISFILLIIGLFHLNAQQNGLSVALLFSLANFAFFIGSARGIGAIREHEGEVVMQSFLCLHLINSEDNTTIPNKSGNEEAPGAGLNF